MSQFLHLLFYPLIIWGVIFHNVNCDAPLIDSASLPLEHRGLYGGPPSLGGGPPGGGGLLGGSGGGVDDPWPLATPDMPQIKNLQVQCEKTHMRVNIEFDRPFYGMIFSKGFYSDPHCVHLKPGTGHLSATFEIFLNSCGMSSSANHNAVGGYGVNGGGGSPTPSGSYVENTIIIQYDPYVQEVWDQARKLRCTWYDFYEKAVTFRPFQVDMLHAVTANFLGDNLQCWMQIQVGKGPWASEVSGIVKIGQTMTMVLAIKDDENKFDMLVRNCVAHDGKRAPIQLVDQYGCVVRPKIMSKFQKIKNFGPSASVVSFAYFQAFKFPDSMNVHFQCVIQVCRYNCPEPKCAGHGFGLVGEYGPPPPAGNSLGTGEYGVPPLLGGVGANEYGGSEYSFPQAFPDPRHPSGPTGAYSEPNENIVPAPQAQVSPSSSSASSADQGISNNTPNPNQQQATTSLDGSLSSSSSSSSSSSASGGNAGAGSGSGSLGVTQQQQQNSQLNGDRINNNEIHLPPPPPPGHHGQYNTVQRKSGIADDLLLEGGGPGLATLGGRPRSVENLSEELRGIRRKRGANPEPMQMTIVVNRLMYRKKRESGGTQEMTDVNTSRTIQVVAPGDVNFALNSSPNNETVVIQSASSSILSQNDSETICMSLPSFVAGLVMLLLVLIVASLVAAFLFVRVRAIDRKGASTTFVNARPYDNAEFVKVTN